MISDPIATVTFNNSERCHLITLETWQEFRRILQNLKRVPDV
jgi:enoyl-CoA hydratase/carnithine racemase